MIFYLIGVKDSYRTPKSKIVVASVLADGQSFAAAEGSTSAYHTRLIIKDGTTCWRSSNDRVGIVRAPGIAGNVTAMQTPTSERSKDTTLVWPTIGAPLPGRKTVGSKYVIPSD
jgi:hypothetical protein